MSEPDEGKGDSAPEPKKSGGVSLEKSAEENHDSSQTEDNADSGSEEAAEVKETVSWKKQVSSIIVWMVSIILFALTVFPGESMWTLIHSFLLGIFGFKSLLWICLLVIWGYLMTKQENERVALNIIRQGAGIILLTDVLGYILVQSNGYRNVYNELSLGFFQLFTQIFRDGEKIGGTGLLGGTIGELLMFIAGKNGAAIIISVLLIALVMFISRTGPLDLYYQARKNIKLLFNPDFYRELLGGSAYRTEKEAYYFSDSFRYDVDDYEDEYPEEVPADSELPDDKPETSDETKEPDSDSPEKNLDEIVKVSLKKKKKLTKAEEIKAESEQITKQVESGDAKSGESDVREYLYPPVRLLIPPKSFSSADDIGELTETAERLIKTLDEYGVKASISDISRGPTVTRYEISPAPGVKINKIKNLSDDIALRLAAQSIRIEAPIPGKSAVGIEIPNKNKQMVRIREILGSREFDEAKGSLTVALGKDIEGNIVLCDLSKMPHLLIAGSTGSGKSVCVNSMLMSILYKYSPKEVRMVLIDPKSVEFDMYNGIPHLLVPVVCEPKKAAGALQWAVSEMLKRYGMLKEHGARNIDNYNRIAEQTGEFEKLCRIVIVIDEMADLMIASPKEVEDAIARLAAMARAAGMYMVLATQRPSVDVITGTIKNNIPSRIALAVSSQVDSRTILDEGGAENLIGYGDMLYHPMGSSKHIRVQGCFVDDVEVERVIKFVKQNGQAEYDDSIADEIERNSLDNSGDSSAEFEGKDEFFEKAVEVVTEAGQASTSMLQRRLGVGYARAGRIIDQLEEHGIIGPHEGSKPRAVLITRTQWMEMTMSRTHAGKNDPIVRSHSEFAAQTLDNGHEEITARQSEFFNADMTDDYDDEELEAEELAPAEDSEPDMDESEIEVDVEPDTLRPDDKPIQPVPEVRDLTRFLFDSDDDFSDVVIEEKLSGSKTSAPMKDEEENAVAGSSSSLQEDEGEGFVGQPRKDAFAEPTEDIPPWEDLVFSTESGEASAEDCSEPGSVEKTEDIPSWEDLLFGDESGDDSEADCSNTEPAEKKDDILPLDAEQCEVSEADFSDSEIAGETEDIPPMDASVEESDDDSDDEDDDDILFSSWIKRL